MDTILHTLFLDNPYLPEEIAAFCDTLPEFREAEQDYQSAGQVIADRVGYETFNRFDEAQSHYIAQLSHAYYLFGLGLRQEVLSALER